MSFPLVRSLLATVFFALSFFSPGPASAQLVLEEEQSGAFLVSHIGSIALLSAASYAIASDPPVVLGARFHQPPAFESSVRENSSPVSSTVSDATLLVSLLAPALSLYGTKEGASYQNSLIVYGQALSTSLLLTSMTKNIALRARPSTLVPESDPELDDHLSFYSGHSSLSFTAAVSGSYLFSATESDLTLRSLHFGTALALASFTAHARVRAGRHYPTDVLVGAFMGTAVGIAAPLLHGVESEISGEEIACAGAGLFLGTALGSLLPNRAREQVAALGPELSVSESGLSLGASGRF